VNHRWLGGLLTNWRTISSRIERLHELRHLKQENQLELLPAKERLAMLAELEKLEANLGGVANMKRQPDAIFIVDLRKEQLAVREAQRLGLPVVALVDTNCDPEEAEYVIPGNDDAIRSCNLIVRVIADGIMAGKSGATVEEMTRSAEGTEETAVEAPKPEVATAAAEVAVAAPKPAAVEPEVAVVEPEVAAVEPEVAAVEPEVAAVEESTPAAEEPAQEGSSEDKESAQ